MTDLRLASLISRDVELLDILLTKARVDSDIHQIDDVSRLQYQQEYSATYERLAPVFLVVLLQLRIWAVDPENAGLEEVFELSADYRVSYRLPEGAEYPEQAYEHFANLNGTIHVWPYWRELVQTVGGRVGISGLTVPVFRAHATPIE